MGSNSVEHMLNELSEKGHFLLLMKANSGYSCVLMHTDEYPKYIMREHFNGPTVLNAVHQAWMEAKKEHKP